MPPLMNALLQTYLGDCLKIIPRLPPDSVEAVITDPPYGLKFMGKQWDHGVPGIPFWKEILRMAKPGAHLLAFGGTRTYHRLTCAIEDAGWEVRDCLMWVYGSGFPKSMDVSKAIDREAGAKRKVVGYDSSRARPNRKYESGAIGNVGGNGTVSDRTDNGATITAPATPEAEKWQGFGTALKPSFEPILLCRKPLEKGSTIAGNVLKHGTGGLNIAACRIPTTGPEANARTEKGRGLGYRGGDGIRGEWNGESGRWPANLLHDGSDEVMEAFAAFGEKKTSSGRKSNRTTKGIVLTMNSGKASDALQPLDGVCGYDDTGSVARFFYCAKSSKKDRGDGNTHNTVKPTSLMQWLCCLVTPPGGLVLDPFMGSASTGVAALREGFRFLGIEENAEYIAIARARLRRERDEQREREGGGETCR